ncbi:hypothetical protein H6P81_019532 [Aristolochia fimbriata]|uniref:Uncharacterized protein n=1 Tax=Aristolochia fimbriata TaxID=158543 RepID=A0AAV7DV57_ARIFI|nr:hypothetical protein H6P81_019532 [Aristolochia fimbriata]
MSMMCRPCVGDMSVMGLPEQFESRPLVRSWKWESFKHPLEFLGKDNTERPTFYSESLTRAKAGRSREAVDSITMAKECRRVQPWMAVVPPYVISPTKSSNIPNLDTIFEEARDNEEDPEE